MKQPKLTLRDLPEGWETQLSDSYNKGAGDEEAMKLLGIIPSQFRDLYKKDEYFRAVIDTGRIRRHAWFLRWGRTHLSDRSANYSGWYMQMKNLFGWSDRKKEILTDSELDNLGDEATERLFEDFRERLLKEASSPK